MVLRSSACLRLLSSFLLLSAVSDFVIDNSELFSYMLVAVVSGFAINNFAFSYLLVAVVSSSAINSFALPYLLASVVSGFIICRTIYNETTYNRR